MTTNQDTINALATQLTKAQGEILAEIETLKAQPAAEKLDFTPLTSKVQALDDLNPDAVPAPVPTPEPTPAPANPPVPPTV